VNCAYVVGVYADSGLSGYTVAPDQKTNNNSVIFGAQGPNFPVNWEPRYAYAVRLSFLLVVQSFIQRHPQAGTASFPDQCVSRFLHVSAYGTD
jgi:hypothetical protein